MTAELGGVALVAYLIGSVPTGLLLARLKQVDVRSTGSGNIGATNVARSAGTTLGLLTLLLDVAKGALPVLLVDLVGLELAADPVLARLARVVAALSTLLGHVFPVTLGFRGGKGVATALGALIALAPAALPLPLLAFTVVFAASRWVSLASLAAAFTSPLSASLAGYPPDVTTAIAAMAVVIILRHRDNIGRLLSGTEPRFERRP